MGWTTRLGKSIAGGAQKLGGAVYNGVDAAVRLVDSVAPAVERVASTIESGAARFGKAATVATMLTAEIPVVGEVVGAAAAAARSVQGAAATVKRGAQFAQSGARAIERVGAIAKDFTHKPNLADAKRYGHELSSIVRHNTQNIKDAREQQKRVISGISLKGNP